jgi:iron complex outermembrane recepter protein
MPFSSSRVAIGRSSLLVGASVAALVLSNPAYAQTAPVQPQPDTSGTPSNIPTPEDTVQDAQGNNVPEGATTETDQSTIVVTGSRIRQPEFTSPDPVALIDPQIAQRQGKIDTAEMLQSSPIAAGSTQITSAISSNFVTDGGPGAQTINLRGLGANRTLVLLNGRRAGPAGTRGGVSSFDLNVLPQSIVSRVDILKTGASSIYGSDAVAGVVNLITKTELDGFQIDGNLSAPIAEGGGEQYRISGMWGKTFDRGHVMVAADFYKQRELKRGDRKYLGCPPSYTFTDESHKERADLIDPRTGKPHCEDLRWGHIWTYDLVYNLYTTNGDYAGPVSLLQFQYPGENLNLPTIDPALGFTSPAGWFPTGYNGPSTAVQNAYHPFVLEQSLIPKTTRYTLYADAAYEITDGIEAYAEFLGNRRKTYQNGWRQIWAFGYTGDFYGDGTLGSPWAQGFTGPNLLSPTGITNHSDTSQKVDYWRGVGGIRGDLGGLLKDWSYDAYVQYSHNKGIYKTEQFLQDIYDSAYFQTSSCVGTTLPFSGKQCIDLPWTDPYFLAGQFTPEQADYMFDWETGKTIYKQVNAEASLSGKLFDLPAGPLGIALGATIRRDEIKDTPGEITFAPNPYYDPTIPLTSSVCTRAGPRRHANYPCEAFHSNAWGNTASGITEGYAVTKELFGEVSVPLLKNQPFFKDLSLSGAARLTNVKSVQTSTDITDKDTGNWTYKIGGNWAVNNWLRFRATYGTSFRAPALFEQFKANETSFVNTRNIDPCVRIQNNLDQGNISQRTYDNCLAALTAVGTPNPTNYAGGAITATVFSQGGIGVLDPETSTAKTASIVLTPTFSFLPRTRLSLAVDYFDIKVKGEIAQLGAGNILAQCYGSEFYPDDPLCGLFQRAGAGAVDPAAVTTVNDKYINIASQRNKGIDVTGLVQQNLGRWGSVNFLASMTWQLKDKVGLFEDTVTDNNGEIGDPKWVGDFNLTWRAPAGWSLFWGVDVIGGASNEDDFRDAHGGDICVDSVIRGHYCVDVKTPATFYHAVSVSKEVKDNYEFTLGVSNLLNTKPPRVSTIGGIGIPALIGPVVGTSQYDFLGRRLFVNVSKKF